MYAVSNVLDVAEKKIALSEARKLVIQWKAQLPCFMVIGIFEIILSHLPISLYMNTIKTRKL